MRAVAAATGGPRLRLAAEPAQRGVDGREQLKRRGSSLPCPFISRLCSSSKGDERREALGAQGAYGRRTDRLDSAVHEPEGPVPAPEMAVSSSTGPIASPVAAPSTLPVTPGGGIVVFVCNPANTLAAPAMVPALVVIVAVTARGGGHIIAAGREEGHAEVEQRRDEPSSDGVRVGAAEEPKYERK